MYHWAGRGVRQKLCLCPGALLSSAAFPGISLSCAGTNNWAQLGSAFSCRTEVSFTLCFLLRKHHHTISLFTG